MHLRRGMAWLAATSLVSVAAAQESGNPEAGLRFARSICAECHAVEGDRDSPNPLSPTFVEIANVPGMTTAAIVVLLSNPHRNMPDLILERGELRDVAAYILTLKRD